MYPLKFEPILKQTLWGGDKIVPFKHLSDNLTGVGGKLGDLRRRRQ